LLLRLVQSQQLDHPLVAKQLLLDMDSKPLMLVLLALLLLTRMPLHLPLPLSVGETPGRRHRVRGERQGFKP